jgi:ankyrin repeat protein
VDNLTKDILDINLPAKQVTNNEIEWGITYNEMGWLINSLKASNNREKGSLRNGENILHVCARNNESEEICQTLIDVGYNVNSTDDYGHTPLYSAIAAGNYEVCETLLNLGADVNHQDVNLNTPLHKSIAENNIDIMKLLISRGAHVNKYNKYIETPLKLAAQEERLDLCRCLIDNGGEY